MKRTIFAAVALAIALTAAAQPSVDLHGLYAAAPSEYEIWEIALARHQEAERALVIAAPVKYGHWTYANITSNNALGRLREIAPEELKRFLSGPESGVVGALNELRAVGGQVMLAMEQANEAKKAAEIALAEQAPTEWEDFVLSKKVLVAAAIALAAKAPDEWAAFLAQASNAFQ